MQSKNFGKPFERAGRKAKVSKRVSYDRPAATIQKLQPLFLCRKDNCYEHRMYFNGESDV